jgi:hypothetical protein
MGCVFHGYGWWAVMIVLRRPTNKAPEATQAATATTKDLLREVCDFLITLKCDYMRRRHTRIFTKLNSCKSCGEKSKLQLK